MLFDGYARDVSIVSIDITNDDNGIVEVDSLAKGIEMAIERKVNIINVSIGTLKESPKLREAVDKATKRGIIIVASAGNYMNKECLYPAAYSNVIAVG